MKKKKREKVDGTQKFIKFKIKSTIFIIISLITVIIQHCLNQIIIPISFYLIVFLIYFFIALIRAAIINSKYLGISSQTLMKNVVLIIIQLCLIALLYCVVNRNIDLVAFKKNAVETVAYVSNVEKDVHYHEDTCNGKIRSGNKCCYAASDNCTYINHYYYAEYEYTLIYTVDNIEYSTVYELKDYKHYKSEVAAQKRSKPKYKINDKVTVYYNKNFPRRVKMSIETAPNIIIYVFEFTIIIIQIISVVSIKSLLKEKTNPKCLNS